MPAVALRRYARIWTGDPLTPRHGQGVSVGRLVSGAKRPTCTEAWRGRYESGNLETIGSRDWRSGSSPAIRATRADTACGRCSTRSNRSLPRRDCRAPPCGTLLPSRFLLPAHRPPFVLVSGKHHLRELEAGIHPVTTCYPDGGL